MKKVWLLGLVAGLLAVAAPADAQRPGFWSMNLQYSPVLGISEGEDVFGEFSWRGGTFDAARAASEAFTVGFSIGWHVLSQRDPTTSVLTDGAVSGTALRHLNAVPLLMKASVFLGERGSVRPFVSLGGGMTWMERRTDTSFGQFESADWHYGGMGELGFSFPRSVGTTLTMSARYNVVFEIDGIEREYLTFSIGHSVGN